MSQVSVNNQYDAIVIGGGAIGAAVAHELMQEGLRLAVVAPYDAEGVASLAAGAMVDAFGEIEKLDSEEEHEKLRLELEAQRVYPSWLERLTEQSERPIFHKLGLFVVGNNGGERDAGMMALMRARMRHYGEQYDEVDPADVPGLKPNYLFRAHEALFIHSALCVDTAALLSALNAILDRFPAATRVDDWVTQVKDVGGHWDVVTRSGERLSADNVVVCAGAHTLQILGSDYSPGLPKLYYGRGAGCIVTGGPEVPHTIRTPNRALSCGIHLVPRANNRLYFGATNLFGTEYDGHLPTGPTVGELHTLFEAIQSELNTSLRNVSIESTKWGLRPVSQFGRPMFGSAGVRGLYVATGTHRTGVSMAPIFAKMLVDEIVGRKSQIHNPYAPEASRADCRAQQSSEREVDVQAGIRSLIATVLFPNGRLPYNRLNELETFMTQLYKMALTMAEDTALRERLRQIHSDIPLDEQGVLRVYHEVLEEHMPDGGPYLT
jgi:glycine oxidase